MRDKYVKNNNFFNIPKKTGDSNVWKEIINHRKYVGAKLKWCIRDGRKILFWTHDWVYKVPLISLVDCDISQYINLNAKVRDFINYDTREWNISSVSNILTLIVIVDIKAIHILCNPMEDKILWGFSQDGKSSLKSATWTMRKLLVHPKHKILNWIWKLNLLSKIKVFL